MEISSNEERKELYNPFVPVDVDPRVTAMKKSTEEKIYIVLYYNQEYEEFKHAIFYGRYNVYFGIKNILDSESIDLAASTVLVETVAIDPVSKNPKRYLIHPENASNIIDFCKQMEAYFGENSYSLAEYYSEDYESESEKDHPKQAFDIELQSGYVGTDVPFSQSIINVDGQAYEFYGGGGGNINQQDSVLNKQVFDVDKHADETYPTIARSVDINLFMDSEAIKNGGKHFLNPATMDNSIESKEI